MSDFMQHSAGYLAIRMARMFEQALAEALAPLGIAPGQFPALLALWHRDGRTQAELVRQIGVEQATLALTLKRMERDGLLRRVPDPDDARARRIFLTPRARALEEEALSRAGAVNAAALAEIEDEEVELFLATMTRVTAVLAQARDARPAE